MILALQGIRIVGALTIAVAHAWPSYIKAIPWWHGAYLLVEMFFVLSGYLVTQALAHRLFTPAQFGSAVIKRFGRLYPLHLFTLVVFLAIFYAKQLVNVVAHAMGINLGMTAIANQDPFDVEYFFLTITFLHGVGIKVMDIFNFPSWSLSMEFWCFVMLTAVLFTCTNRAQRIAAAAGMLLFCAIYYLTIWWTPAGLDTTIPIRDVLPRGILSYFAGMLAFELRAFLPEQPRDRVLSIVQVILATLIVIVMCGQPKLTFSAYYTPLLWGAMIVSMSWDRGVIANFFKRPTLVWLGDRSFAIYLVHAVVLLVIKRPVVTKVDSMLARTLIELVYLGVVLIAADWCHRNVELLGVKPAKAVAKRFEAWMDSRSGTIRA